MSNLLLFPAPDLRPAQPPDAQPPDHAEREQALDLRQSFIVEAPAGSGKTALLIQRFLKLLASVDDPAEVLAITFTRKATAELTDRVFRQLTAAAAGSVPSDSFDATTRPLAEAVLARDAGFGWNLLEGPQRLNIRTIDSVCADIAATLPILSGSGGNQSPSEDAATLYAEAARRTLALLGSEDPALNRALRTILFHRDANLANCEALLASMLGARDQWGELIPLTHPKLDDAFLDREVLPRLEKALDLAICRGLTRLTKILPEPILEGLCVLAAEMGHLGGYKDKCSPISICAGRHQSPEAKAEHLAHWRALIHLLVKPSKPRDFRASASANHIGFQILKHHQEELKQIIAQVRETPGLLDALCEIDQLPPAQYPPDQWHVTKALFQVLARALTELQSVFAAGNRCDFAEIALLAKAALRADSVPADLADVRPALQHLLVDEMQDTSTTQYELLQLLTRGWDGSSRTVFLVGDPKQSIYLFREARVERFVETMNRGHLGPLPLTALHLTANFRSQANLVHAFNEDFARIFPSPESTQTGPAEPAVVPYRAASATREPSSAASVVWHLHPIPSSAGPIGYGENGDEQTSPDEQATLDAHEIRSLIEAWRLDHASATHPPRIAVLVQSRAHLLPIVKVFKEPGPNGPLPYRAIKGESLAERQEILDLVALTRALLHRADRAAWFALLRTPLCGLTLADLHQLAGADNHAFAQHTLLELIHERGDLLSTDGIARLEPFWHIMQAALAERGRTPISQLVLRTWRTFGAHRFAGDEESLNVEQYFALLDELETSTGILSLPALEHHLRKLYAAPSNHPGAVELMTIHNAKGLEWDLVFVPSLDRPGRSNETRLLDWIETDGGNELLDAAVAHGILAPIRSKGGESGQLNQWIQSISKAREAAERKRLFYVACTRAREQVHLFAAPKRKADGTFSVSGNHLLAAAWPAAQTHLGQIDSPSNVIALARPRNVEELLTLAASGTPPERRIERSIERIPASHITASLLHPTPPAQTAHFSRPEGGLRVRAFGKTLHAFLEKLAARIATGSSLPSLVEELPAWSARIAAVLRAGGLAGPDAQALTLQVLRGLQKTLASPEGQWLLQPHPQAASEHALSAWAEEEDHLTNLRLDRTFLAGNAPFEPGTDHLWIIDYKSSTHAETGLESWLEQQRATYREQLESYAHALRKEGRPIRLALYFPLLSRLLWWSA